MELVSDIIFTLIFFILLSAVASCVYYKGKIISHLKSFHRGIYDSLGLMDSLDDDEIKKENNLRVYIKERKFVSLNDFKLNNFVFIYNFFGYTFVSSFFLLMVVAFYMYRNNFVPTLMKWLNQLSSS